MRNNKPIGFVSVIVEDFFKLGAITYEVQTQSNAVVVSVVVDIRILFILKMGVFEMKVKRGDIIYLKNSFPKDHHIQGGNRPYLVISNDMGNYYSDICIIVPLTTAKKKKELPTHTRIKFHNSLCLCEQMFTVVQDNIESVPYHLDHSDMEKVNNCISVSLFRERR